MKMVTFSRHAMRISARSIRPILRRRNDGIHHVKSHVRRIHHRRAGVVAMTSVGRYMCSGFSLRAVFDDDMMEGAVDRGRDDQSGGDVERGESGDADKVEMGSTAMVGSRENVCGRTSRADRGVLRELVRISPVPLRPKQRGWGGDVVLCRGRSCVGMWPCTHPFSAAARVFFLRRQSGVKVLSGLKGINARIADRAGRRHCRQPRVGFMRTNRL